MIMSEILLCCYVQLLVAFFWMWDWILTGLSYRLRHTMDLWGSTVTSELDPFHCWSQALLMSTSGSPPHSTNAPHSFFTLSSCPRVVALSSASMTFAVSPSLFPLCIPLSISLPTCSALCESVLLRGRASFFWKPAIGHDMMGQGTNQ